MATSESGRPPGFDEASPEIQTVSVPACPVCGGTQRVAFGQGWDYELQTCCNLWQFWQCDNCTAVWLDPRPHADELAIIYPSRYYAYAMSEKLSPIILKGKALLDRMKLAGILKQLGREPRSYLDIGCGDGRYLYQFAAQGMPKENIYGMDLSSPALAKLRDAGFRIFDTRVEDCTEIKPNSLDLITMFHVIEHVEDPNSVLRQLATWLTPGGVLAIETPNVDSLDLRLFKRTWWGGYHIPRHWTLFSEASITRALRACGLDVIGLAYQTGHSFWLYSLHHQLKFNAKRPMPGLARWFDPMRSRMFLALFTGLDLTRRTLGAKTSAMLILARKPV